MSVSRARSLTAALLSVLVAVGVYVAATKGARLAFGTDAGSAAATANGPGAVPEQLYNVPDTVPTTSDYGPVGEVAVVFAGTDVVTGLRGRLDRPWIAVSSHTADYRALDVPHPPPPAADAISVSPDGSQLAWGSDEGVVVYDAVEDRAREVTDALGPSTMVGGFSPGGDRLLVHDGSLRVLDVASGRVVASVRGVPARSARHAVWTPDGRQVSYMAGRRLVRVAPGRPASNGVPVDISPTATLAWSPSGERLAATRRVRGVTVVDVYGTTADGRLQRARTLRPAQTSVQRLLGFTSDSHLTVTALGLATGSIERVYRLSATDATTTEVMQLAGEGSNWVGSQTAAFALRPLAQGSVERPEPRWPWSHGAKLLASVVLALFLLGLYLTRRTP